VAVIDEQIVIRRKPQEVYDYVIDLTNQPKWETTVLSVTPRDGSYTVHDGSEIDYVFKLGAMKLKGVSVISGLEPGHTGHYSVSSRLGKSEGSYTVEEHPDGALFTHHVESQPRNAMERALDGVSATMLRRQLRRGVQNLKSQLEG